MNDSTGQEFECVEHSEKHATQEAGEGKVVAGWGGGWGLWAKRTELATFPDI